MRKDAEADKMLLIAISTKVVIGLDFNTEVKQTLVEPRCPNSFIKPTPAVSCLSNLKFESCARMRYLLCEATTKRCFEGKQEKSSFDGKLSIFTNEQTAAAAVSKTLYQKRCVLKQTSLLLSFSFFSFKSIAREIVFSRSARFKPWF